MNEPEKPDEEAGEPASPACAAHLVDDAYQGYMPRAELVELLQALLAAERALADGDGRDAALAAMLRRLDADADVPPCSAADTRGGIVRSIDAALPRVRDDSIYAALRAMRDAHAARLADGT